MNTQDSTRENFTSIRKKQYLIVTPIVLVSVLVLILVQADLIDISLLPGLWMVLATIAILGSLIFSFYNWRCPACKRYLGKRIGPQFCPNCGVKLE